MGLEDIYPRNLQPLDPDFIDSVLSGLEPQDYFKGKPNQAPSVAEIVNRLDIMAERARRIETDKRAITDVATDLAMLETTYPERYAQLSSEDKARIAEWTSRLRMPDQPKPKLEPLRSVIGRRALLE